MPSPTDRQRIVHVKRGRPTPQGLDAMSHHCLGWLHRGPWHRTQMMDCAQRIDLLREEFAALKDGVLDDRINAIRALRKSHPQDVEGTLEEGLALLAVVAQRQLGLSPYVVQLMSAAALAKGYLTEVDTGEGKTLALALTAAYQAWTGLPCHIITANDYLAGRDAEQLETFYQRAGLSVGRVLGDSAEGDRRQGYSRSVTYTTAKEVAADYLRDRLRLEGLEESGARLGLARLTGPARAPAGEPVQRGLYFGLLDEADNSLIDEAVTPLIISRNLEAGELENACSIVWEVASKLVPEEDYEVDQALKSIRLDSTKVREIASKFDIPGAKIWTSVDRRAELLRLALEAREFFLRDVQYVVDDGKVVIVDEATGRPMPMRTWRQGLHQMVEAKENVALSGATETLARISFQAFFRKYQNLAGASGTVREVASEIWETYGVPTLRIPRHLTSQRQFLGWRFHPNLQAKAAAIAAEIKVRHARGQPVLVGMRSVETSEMIAGLLSHEGLPCVVLNAKKHREEALTVMQAGHRSRITVATNMAGRGTDIQLDPGVHDLGGLHVVASEPHESARVDRQLFGRSGRHGDPGSVLAIYSAEDPLFERFIPRKVRAFWSWCLSQKTPWGGWAGQNLGRVLLWTAQFRAQSAAKNRRKQVAESELEMARGLGFTKGNSKF